MNRSYNKIPVYTGDVSGAASALYELGGMVVIHDPSGCNSTYNTHDEIRWYDQESLIYITGLNHVDAIMGNDDKVIRDVVRAATELKPKFIALASSPIPFMNGTDFKALTKLIAKKTGIDTFFVETNGMHDYSVGAGNALAEIAKRILADNVADGKDKKCINLCGVTPLDFAAKGSVDSMKSWLSKRGWDEICCFAMGDSLEKLQQAKHAKISLVVSSVGLKTAKVLEERFGIPYVCGTPVKDFEYCIQDAIYSVLDSGISQNAWERIPRVDSEKEVTLIGEPVQMESLAAVFRKKGYATRVLCPLEQPQELLMEGDLLVKGEEEPEKILKESTVIVADPMYRSISNKEAVFVEVPHLAFSGRVHLRNMKNLVEEAIYE